MDIAEFFKKGFKNLQKELIDKNYRKKSLQTRKESLINARRQTRDTLRFNHRKIDPNHMSPCTPIMTNKKETTMSKELPLKKEVVNSKRIEMLKQWKEKKMKLKQEEKKHAKPIFKVFHVDKRLGLHDLENVNKEIKGKPIKPLKNEFPKSFAPTHHKFIAPKHVQPIHFNKLPSLDKPKVNKKTPNIPKSIAPVHHKFIAPTQVQPIHLNKQPSLDTQKVNKSTSNITRKILPRINSNISIKSLPNITSNGKGILPNKSVGMKKIQPGVMSNKTKRLPDAGTRSSSRIASSTNGRSNLNKEKVGSKKAVKAKVVEEPNTKKSESKTQHGFKTPVSKNKAPKDDYYQIKAPKDDYEPKSVEFKTPEKEFKTPKNEYQVKSLSTRKVTPWLKKPDEGSNNSSMSGENKLNDKSVIIIDDSLDDLVVNDESEATMKTPIKKHTPRHTSKYTPRPPSVRKSHANKDSCILCLDSPISDAKKTPSTRAKTPTSRAKTPTTRTKTPTTRTKTPTTKVETPMTKTPKTKAKTPKSKKKSDKNYMATVLSDSEEFSDNVIKTPNAVRQTPVYVSPFVTITRGKDSARKEYGIRKSTGGTLINGTDGRDFTDTTSPRAGAEYFEMMLDNEISKIEAICVKWEKYKAENEMTEETIDMINVATGQSRLLITRKFEQFRGLINQCKLCSFEEKPITCEDLHGFWDMIYQQVVDVGKRFDNLERIKDNNWEEILPEKKVVKKKVRGRPKKPAATSSLKEMIKAAKNKNKQQANANQSLIKEPKTPENMKIASPIRGNSSRRSLRVSLLQGPTLKRISSPGLTMMKITQAIKAGDGLTPSKSILKTDLTKSAKRHTKSVLFVENVVPKKVIFSPEDKENNPKQANLNNSNEILVNRRMSLRSSTRLSKS